MACAQSCPKCNRLLRPNGRYIEKGTGRTTQYYKCDSCGNSYRDTPMGRNRPTTVKFCENHGE